MFISDYNSFFHKIQSPMTNTCIKMSICWYHFFWKNSPCWFVFIPKIFFNLVLDGWPLPVSFNSLIGLFPNEVKRYRIIAKIPRLLSKTVSAEKMLVTDWVICPFLIQGKIFSSQISIKLSLLIFFYLNGIKPDC